MPNSHRAKRLTARASTMMLKTTTQTARLTLLRERSSLSSKDRQVPAQSASPLPLGVGESHSGSASGAIHHWLGLCVERAMYRQSKARQAVAVPAITAMSDTIGGMTVGTFCSGMDNAHLTLGRPALKA